MKHKTAELTGELLDKAVALAEGLKQDTDTGFSGVEGLVWYRSSGHRVCNVEAFKPSTNWAQGGPIIDRENIATFKGGRLWAALVSGKEEWIDTYTNEEITGPTPLIAAMRCFVASKLGDEVDL